MKIFSIIIVLAGVSLFFHGSQVARAQVGGTGIAQETSPVGVVPEGEPEIEFSREELRLVGSDCDINEAEASLLRTKGVVAVDVELKPGSLVVDYDPNTVRPQQMVGVVAKRMDGTDIIGQRMGGKKAVKRNCRAEVVR